MTNESRIEMMDSLERKKIAIDELNLKNKMYYKIKYAAKDLYSADEINLTVKADCAEDALNEAELNAFNEGIDLDHYDIEVYRWIPETLMYHGDWEMVDFEQIEEIDDLKQLEGKTIKSIKTTVKHDDKLKEIHIEFEDQTDITLRLDNTHEPSASIDILKLPF